VGFALIEKKTFFRQNPFVTWRQKVIVSMAERGTDF
jgi:hypothetical protein